MSHQRTVPMRLVILFLLFWLLWTARLGARFYGEQDSFRTWIPAAVRNYSIYDYNTIGLMIVRNAYIDDVENLYFYSHHPPLMVWLPALVAEVAGQNEVSIRFVFPVAMMIASAAFYVFVKHLYGENIAFWAVVFFSITPFTTYFETSYGPDPLAFMAFMLFGAIFVYWLQHPTMLRFVGLVATTILAAWSAWPAVIFVGIFGICGLFFVGWRQRVEIVGLGIIAVVSIVLMILLYEYWWAGSFNSLMDAYVWRSSTASSTANSETFTLIQWISRNAMDIVTFGSLGLVVLSSSGVFFLLRCGTRYANDMTLSLLLAAITYFLLFRNATYVHHFYKAFIIPSMAIAAGASVVYGRKLYPRIMRPVSDGFIVIFFAQALFVLLLLVRTTHQPSLTHIIDYIKALENESERIIITYDAVHPSSENAVEYYTMRPIDWTIGLDEIDPDEEVLYILCDENQQYVSDFYEGNPPEGTKLDDLCTAYDLPPTAED